MRHIPIPGEDMHSTVIHPHREWGCASPEMHILTGNEHSLYRVLFIKQKRVFDRGKGELENAKGRDHESVFTFKIAFLECFQTAFVPQAELSVVLLTREKCHTVNISSRHLTYRINVKKPS